VSQIVAGPGDTIVLVGGFTGLEGSNRLAILDRVAGTNAAQNYTLTVSPGNVAVHSPTGLADTQIYVNDGPSQGIRRYTTTSATVDATWLPNTSDVTGIVSTPAGVVVSGPFTVAGGNAQTRLGAARLDRTTANADGWNPGVMPGISGQRVATVVTTGTSVVLAGDFVVSGALRRTGLAAIDLRDGTVTSFAPNPGGSVEALALHGTSLYVGGAYLTIGGQAIDSLARVNLPTGTVDASFIPAPNGAVRDIVVATDGSALWVAGTFSTIGGQTRSGVARLESSGIASAGFPNLAPTGAVESLSLTADASQLLIGGSFSGAASIGGQARNFFATANPSTGAILALPPQPGDTVDAIHIDGAGNTWLGGAFNMIDGLTRDHVAKLGSGFAPVTPLTDRVRAITTLDTIVVLASSEPDGAGVRLIMDLNATSGAVLFGPQFQEDSQGTARSAAVVASRSVRIVGGEFNGTLGKPSPYLALFADAPTVTTGTTSAIGPTTATLGGNVTGAGLPVTRRFRFGTDPALATFTEVTLSGAVDPLTAESFSQAVTGLTPSTQYFFQAVGSSLTGTTLGSIVSFTTAATPSPSPSPSPSVTATPGLSTTAAAPFAAKGLVGGW
jgi:hypothetical protein